ncbi:putative membrane protein [Geomicrobium sediminis]|uniref:Membrane protein n=1 Tax=Geomicrobium sediminis TaxID=1347788 RepID=A0ABS2PCR8_9BACL|nr:putative membrane protein [Geomicrobium sediminis]
MTAYEERFEKLFRMEGFLWFAFGLIVIPMLSLSGFLMMNIVIQLFLESLLFLVLSAILYIKWYRNKLLVKKVRSYIFMAIAIFFSVMFVVGVVALSFELI